MCKFVKNFEIDYFSLSQFFKVRIWKRKMSSAQVTKSKYTLIIKKVRMRIRPEFRTFTAIPSYR
jgi:hypothetical protein